MTDINDVTIQIATGRRRDDREFLTRTHTVGAFIDHYFSDFQRGPKDGLCILQGNLVGTQRASRNVKANYIVMLDHDSGETMDEIAEKIEAFGVTAVLWNTHSHLTTQSEIGQDALDRFMKLNDITDLEVGAAQYLHEKKGVVEAILNSITEVYTDHREGGVKYIVEHGPMPKCRSLFVLDAPFEFAVPGVAHKDRIEEWKARYKGFAQALGVVVDEKTCDPARLMYIPRIAPTADRSRYEIRFLDGRALSVSDMPEYIDPARAAAKARQEVSALLADVSPVATGGERAKYQTPGLAKFLAVGKKFLASQWMNHVGEFRADRGEGRAEFMCPYDDMHSNPGDPLDKAFLATDWTEEAPWHMGCQHQTCSAHTGGDRAQYLDQACVLYGVRDAAELLTWCADAELAKAGWAHERAEKVVEAPGGVDVMIDALVPDDARNNERMALLYAAIARSRDGDAARDQRIRAASKKLRVGIKVIRDGVGSAPSTAAHPDEPNEVAAPALPTPPNDPSHATTIWSHWGYDDRMRCAEGRMKHLNDKDPYIFEQEGGNVVRLLERKDTGNVNIRIARIATSGHWVSVFRRKGLSFVEPHDDHPSGKSIAPHKDVVEGFLGGSEVSWPMLERVSDLPVFSSDGTLLTTKGYDENSRVYVNPSCEFYTCEPGVTEEAMETALGILFEALRDFPFSDAFDGVDPHPIRTGELDEDGFPLPNLERGQSSRAHFIALFLQPFVRNMIDGPTPAFLIDKSKPGTGAGFLANILGAALYGAAMPAEAVSTNKEEFRKAITTTIRGGSATIFLDNINDKLDSGSLAAALTTGKWKDRLLGTNELIDVPVRATWILSANKARFSPELMRRIVPIRLDASVPNPASDRPMDFYKHQNFSRWLKEHRLDLVWAAHTIIQYWVDRACPLSREKVLQSFSAWSEVMGGILETAGIPGFLDNIPAYLSDRVEDEDSRHDRIAEHLYATFRDQKFTPTEAAAVMMEGDRLAPQFGIEIAYGGSATVVIGRELTAMTGETFRIGELYLNLKRKRTNGGTLYAFEVAQNVISLQPKVVKE